MYAQQRLYFLDHLKWFIIWLMVVFHAAMCYMAFAPQWWYVVDSREPVFSATVFICWADIFIMPVMFFISEYFGLQSLVRHEEKEFWRRKLWRIVLPWLFGVLFIAPPVTYLILASRSAPMDFWTFYTTLFWGPLYEQAQYWYLGALLALYVLLTLAVRLFPALRTRSAEPVRRQGRLFLALFLLTFLSIGVLGSYLSPDLWQPFFYVLVLQPVRIPTYLIFFFLGAHAFRQRWFAAAGYTPANPLWLVGCFLFSALYLWQRFTLPALGASAQVIAWTNAFCQAAFTWTATLGLLGFFQRYLGRTTPLRTRLSETSYGVYYLHMAVLFPVVWAARSIDLGVYFKYALVCLVTLLLCDFLARYGLSHLSAFALRKRADKG